MTVGAPMAEANFKEAIATAEKEDRNVEEYPVIYVGSLYLIVFSRHTFPQAFHGSPLRNWHSVRSCNPNTVLS